ncbi:MAG: hypothetical protein V3V01_18630 [Acidimicrobiales bacterium]
MCHQSVGLIARHLEAAGLPTIGLTSALSITAAANPPRSVLIDLPLGHTSGAPDDRVGQRQLLADALAAGYGIAPPSQGSPGTIVELAYRWIDDDWKANPLSWTRASQDGGSSGTSAGDTRTGRSLEPVYQTADDEALAAKRSSDEHCLTCLGLPAV